MKLYFNSCSQDDTVYDGKIDIYGFFSVLCRDSCCMKLYMEQFDGSVLLSTVLCSREVTTYKNHLACAFSQTFLPQVTAVELVLTN